MTAFAGKTYEYGRGQYQYISFKIEFGVMPELVQAIEDMDWL